MDTGLRDILHVRTDILRRFPHVPPLGLPPPRAKTSLSPAEVAIMAHIAAMPFLGVDDRAALLDMTSGRLRPAIKRLVALGYLQWSRFSRKVRGYIAYCNITEEGFKASGLAMPEEGGGSFLHRKCQLTLRHWYSQRGIEARLEYCLCGRRADVGITTEGRTIAVECGLSSADNEADNVMYDLKAGFSEVLLLLRESTMREQVTGALDRKMGGVPDVLKVELLTCYLEADNKDTEPAPADTADASQPGPFGNP